jgi:1-acylglycerone phosphate reductase
MKPFDVSVMSILTGMVLSNCHSYFDDFRLPDKSLYKQIEGKIGDYARGRDGMPTMDYAAHVVGKITDRTTAKYWYGPLAHHVKERMAPPVSHENTVSQISSSSQSTDSMLTRIGP